ncbi:hypothetical protein DRN74_04425 [Candidatus Micrarchaeota archaeon]|nr:MAG: hypothetical protein DRN74_04425 [Candidatus Micrarchaeota archaeon]
MINIIAAFLGLLYSTYTDIKTGYVDDWLSHTLIVLGVIFVPIFYPHRIIEAYLIAALVFALGFVLYIFGNIGGGDVKLFTAISLLLPYYNEDIAGLFSFLGIRPVIPPYPFIFSVFLLSGIIFMLVMSSFYFYKILKYRKKIEEFHRKALIGFAYAVVLLPFFYYWSYFSWFFTLLYIPISITCFIIPFKADFVKLFFARKKSVSKLDDDDILALEIMDKDIIKKLGVKRKTHTNWELKKIKENAKKYGIKTVPVCENLPKYVPYILISFILNLLTGDFFLYMLKLSNTVIF